MHDRSKVTGSTASASSDASRASPVSAGVNLSGPSAEAPDRAALTPDPKSVSAAQNPLPGGRADTPAEAVGRRTLSTAFVRIGPDGLLTVELRNGQVLDLRDVVMRPRDYCGVEMTGDRAGAKFCGGYAEVAAARAP